MLRIYGPKSKRLTEEATLWLSVVVVCLLAPAEGGWLFNPSTHRCNRSQIEDALQQDRCLSGGRFRLSPRRLNLRKTVEKCFASCCLQQRFKEHVRTLKMQLSMSADMPQFILADPARVFQLVTNCLGNSIKFCPAGESVRVALRSAVLLLLPKFTL